MPKFAFAFLPVFAALPALVAAPANGQTLVGRAEIVDGDTIAIGGSEIDLSGIDAPELRQTCLRGSESWACGEDARQQLQGFIADRTVRCAAQDNRQNDAQLAVCSAGTLDLAGAMVEAGLAVALGSPSTGYGPDADRAQRNRIGLWSSDFQPPADWRAANPLPASTPAPASAGITGNASPRRMAGRASNTATPASSMAVASGSCTIKGNRNYQGEWIYHLPGMPYYERTRPEEWFCTEAQAQAAGYRRAIVRR